MNRLSMQKYDCQPEYSRHFQPTMISQYSGNNFKNTPNEDICWQSECNNSNTGNNWITIDKRKTRRFNDKMPNLQLTVQNNMNELQPIKNELPDNLMFVVFINENGKGYEDEFIQKIVTFGYDKTSIENIYNIIHLINRQNTYNRKMLNFNILDYDMTILNFDYLNKYSKVVDYRETHILSVDIDNEHELSETLANLFTLMINDKNVIQILYSRRKKYIESRKTFFFLIKILIEKTYTVEYIKQHILTKDVIPKKIIKLKISDIDIDKTNKNERGVRRNNWINI